MGPKQWRTTSEIEGRIAASAWQWLQTTSEPWAETAGVGIGLARALFSRFLLPNLVVKHRDCCWATLGRGKWAALVWPLVQTVQENGFSQFTFVCDESGRATWHNVLDVDDDYVVFPYEDVLATNGIVVH